MVYLISIHIPLAHNEDLTRIIKYLQDEQGSKNCALSETNTHFEIRCRVSQSYLSEVLDNLQRFGVGVDYGVVDVQELTLTFPTIQRTRHKGFRENALPLRLIRSMVSSGAGLSVDFCLYVIVASMLAGVGLATNNAVTIVASMLVSPLMTPICGLSFGILMLDSKLIIKSTISEIVGLFLCFLTGIFVGFLTVPFTGERSGFITQFEWPNQQMMDRGTYGALFTGLFVAIPSGVGVPLSMVGNNINSLVGVAISAALLPPVVCSAMNFVFGLTGPMLNPTNISRDMARLGLEIAAYSFALFMENLLVILFFSILVLKLKKVGPLKRVSRWYTSLPTLNVGAGYGSLEDIDGEQWRVESAADGKYQRETTKDDKKLQSENMV